MKSVDLLRKCGKSISSWCEGINKQLDKIEDPEEKVRLCICGCTLSFFSIGMIFDIAGYIFSASYMMLIMNLCSLAVYAATTILYIYAKIGLTIALYTLLFTIQINISISIFHNYQEMALSSNPFFSHDLFIGFLVCILASLAIKKSFVHILCLMPLTALAASLIVSYTPWMISHFLSLCLAFISPPVLLTYIRKLMWDTIRKKDRLMSEQKSLRDMMGMNEEQWDIVVDTIQKPHTPRRQTEELIEKMQNAISDQLVIRAERLLASEEVVERINEKHKLNLTAKEVRLCCLILEDKSIMEISRILYINESSVRASRSRIRKKLMLDKEMNLKAHLMMLVSKEINAVENNFQAKNGDDSK